MSWCGLSCTTAKPGGVLLSCPRMFSSCSVTAVVETQYSSAPQSKLACTHHRRMFHDANGSNNAIHLLAAQSHQSSGVLMPIPCFIASASHTTCMCTLSLQGVLLCQFYASCALSAGHREPFTPAVFVHMHAGHQKCSGWQYISQLECCKL